MKNYRLELSYDGTAYRGWQKQGNTKNTIQQKLETVLGQVLGEPVEIAGSGRTDAGAHARMQVVSFRANTFLSEDEILRRLREALPEDIGAVSLKRAGERFHARLNCRGKSYLYRIWVSTEPCVFERRYVYVLGRELNVEAMNAGARILLGTRDFAAFTTAAGGKKSTVRTLTRAEVKRVGPEVRLTFSGDGFLYNMVRIITGTLIEIGLGQRPPEDISSLLLSGKRENAGPTAPAKGLCLVSVEY